MTRAIGSWGTRAARSAFTRSLSLLLATLGVLAMTATVADAQPRTRGRVIIETHHTDLAGNIRLSMDEAGTPTAPVIDHTPFGDIIGASCNGGGDPTGSPQFQGTLRDSKTCLDDFGARDYDMVTGRFQSVDPVLPVETALRDPQQWNRDAYVRNNPLIYTDPDGRVLWPLAIAADAVVTFQLVFDHEGVLNAPAPGDQTVAGPKIEEIALDARSMTLSRGTSGLSNVIARAIGDRKQEAPTGKGGRLGNEASRAHVGEVATEMEKRGWKITGGGGRGPEEYLPGPGGARRGSSYPDITATMDGKTLRVNTVDTRADGVTPTTREATNAARIRAKTGEHVLTIPNP